MNFFNEAFWAIVPGIIVGVTMGFWNRRQKKRDDDQLKRENARIAEQNEREKERIKSERLRISLLVSTAQLSYAVAMAWKRGKPNGEVEIGVETYNKAMEEFRAYERELLAKSV